MFVELWSLCTVQSLHLHCFLLPIGVFHQAFWVGIGTFRLADAQIAVNFESVIVLAWIFAVYGYSYLVQRAARYTTPYARTT